MADVKFAYVDPRIAIETPEVIIDWKKCALCQKILPNEKLIRPKSTVGESCNDSYTSLASSMKLFYDIGEVPLGVDLTALDDGTGLENSLRTHEAVWHKYCHAEFSTNRLERAKKRASTSEKDTNVTCSLVKLRKPVSRFEKDRCMFCDGDPSVDLRKRCKVSTIETSDKIISTAGTLRDSLILSKTAGALDLIALEAEYHPSCLASYYNRLRKQESGVRDEELEKLERTESLALTGLVQHMLAKREENDGVSPVFRMTQLAEVYREGMKDLGGTCSSVRTTRLKAKLLERCPLLQATGSAGKELLIFFRDDVDEAIRTSAKRNYDLECMAFSDAADAIKKDILDHPASSSEPVDDILQSKSCVPASLKSLIRMILYGSALPPNLEGDEENCSDQAVESISQIILFHRTKRVKRSFRRHIRKRETPVPKFVALKIYSETRSKNLVEIMSRLGLSVSYSRLQCILSEVGNSVSNLYHSEQVVCPPALRKGIFTTASADNIDHNPTSTTANTAFHGTAIGMMQHFGSEEGAVREIPPSDGNIRKIRPLPLEYANVKPIDVSLKGVVCPATPSWTSHTADGNNQLTEEKDWLDQTSTAEGVCWSVFHAQKSSCPKYRTTSEILPIFTEQAHDAATMIHVMGVVKKGIQHLNPDQTPVLVVDQPLYALCKQIQFIKDEEFGGDKMFIMMGGLHIEMDILRILGQWLNESGWVEALVKSNVMTSGRADALIRVNYVLRSRYAHQVTAAVLHNLQKKAYEDCAEDSEGDLSFEDWLENKLDRIPQFQYWDIAKNLQLTMLQLVRSIRTANFSLYKESLKAIVPWCFALNHVHYARWLSVHIRDLDTMSEQVPGLNAEFSEGKFVASKQGRKFSNIALDQAHEQLNALLKGHGGMIGLMENRPAFKKWTLSAPLVANIVHRYQVDVLHIADDISVNHHLDSPSANEQFRTDVQSLEEVFKEWGNPFLEEGSEIYNIESHKVANKEMVDTVKTVESTGKELYRSFAANRLCSSNVGLMEPIKRNKVVLFTTRAAVKSKTQSKLSGLKNDCALFARLYIACQNRVGDLEEFFRHENQPFPPSLSINGEPRSCQKSDLMKCLMHVTDSSTINSSPPVEAKLSTEEHFSTCFIQETRLPSRTTPRK